MSDPSEELPAAGPNGEGERVAYDAETEAMLAEAERLAAESDAMIARRHARNAWRNPPTPPTLPEA